MPQLPAPSAEEIVRLYRSGELATELAQHHQKENGKEDSFLERCVTLHNGGEIDLLDVASQPAFTRLPGPAFFTAQYFYCNVIPRLSCDVYSLMKCCRALVEQGGGDLAANHPNAAFRTWCQNNQMAGLSIVEAATKGDELARQFVTFALQAANDINGAIDFILDHTDERRLSGMTALAGMTFDNLASAQKAIATLESFVALGNNDNVRINALLSAFSVLTQQGDNGIAKRLIESAVKEPGPETLHGLARIVWQHRSLLDSDLLRLALVALEAVNPEHLGTLKEIDLGLRQLLGTKDETSALDFLTAKLRDDRLKIGSLSSTEHELANGDRQRLYELVVRWFLSGSMSLCDNASNLISIEKDDAFDTSVQPLGLSSVQQIFLCRKAIGFLFIKPVACCSIIVSVLRGGNLEIESDITNLLLDPMLLNYGGDARDYLAQIPPTDPAYDAVQKALAKVQSYYAGIDAVGTLRELHPSEYQRDVVRHRIEDEM